MTVNALHSRDPSHTWAGEEVSTLHVTQKQAQKDAPFQPGRPAERQLGPVPGGPTFAGNPAAPPASPNRRCHPASVPAPRSHQLLAEMQFTVCSELRMPLKRQHVCLVLSD